MPPRNCSQSRSRHIFALQFRQQIIGSLYPKYGTSWQIKRIQMKAITATLQIYTQEIIYLLSPAYELEQVKIGIIFLLHILFCSQFIFNSTIPIKSLLQPSTMNGHRIII